MYYPDQRFVSELVTIRREVSLPDDAIGQIQVAQGDGVDIRDKVARGFIPSDLTIIPAAEMLGLRDPANLPRFLLVEPNTGVREGDPIAGRDARRGRRVFAPINGKIVYIGSGRIVMQANPRIIELEAGVRGTVVATSERRLTIQATGALVQGVWGNGRNVISTLTMEPDPGIENLTLDDLDTTYRGVVMVTARPLQAEALAVAETRGMAGIIAPSMDATLIPDVLAADRAIFLTEGFGSTRMGSATASLLRDFDGSPVTLDAYLPQRWSGRRPEAVINTPSSDKPDALGFRTPLKRGMRVRISREPFVGQIGRVNRLPRSPMTLENGLRTACALVDIPGGDTVPIPLANLELAGG